MFWHPLPLATVIVILAAAVLKSVIPTPVSAGAEPAIALPRQFDRPRDGRPAPGASGASEEVTATIDVSGTADYGMRRFHAGPALGDGGVSETQAPLFRLAPGAVLKNVVLAAPAADGVHCTDLCTLENVHWEDVGEDAASFFGDSASNVFIIRGGSARNAHGKIFQFDGAGALIVSGFDAADFGTLVASCGTCAPLRRTIEMQDVSVRGIGTTIATINPDNGDTATFRRITVYGSRDRPICDVDGPRNGDGPNGAHCRYSSSDISYQ